MDFWDLAKLMLRRYRVSVPLFVASVSATLLTGLFVPPEYQATGYLMVLPPSYDSTKSGTETETTGVPTVASLVDALVIYSGQDEMRDALGRDGLSMDWQAGRREGRTDIVEIAVVASDPETANATLNRLSELLGTKLVELQQPFIAPDGSTVAARAVELGSSSEAIKTRSKRALIAVAATGLILTVAITVAVDAILRYRQARQRHGDDTTTPPRDGDSGLDVVRLAAAVGDLPIAARLAARDHGHEENDVVAAAFYEFYELDSRIAHHTDSDESDGPMADLHRYYDPILMCVDSATHDFDYAFNLLGPPPEPLDTPTGSRPHMPIGSAR